jgi:tRNA-dihydrouridine synthase A
MLSYPIYKIKQRKINMIDKLVHTLSVAPMLDWTDKHCRFFHRLLTPNAILYTEMLTTGAIIYGNAAKYLDFNQAEHPVILQLGGSDPAEMAKCALIAQNHGYAGVNINCGCPSERVQKGSFGACLMQDPDLVVDCYTAMSETCNLPISVKHRIGVNDIEDYSFLAIFVEKLYDAGCRNFIVHARNAILKGLSPKENREIPKLKYDYVYKLKQNFKDATITINGGIQNAEDAIEHLKDGKVDGVMIGRSAYHTPVILNLLDSVIFLGVTKDIKADVSDQYLNDITMKMCKYCIEQVQVGQELGTIIRHILGLYHGRVNSRLWRQHLSNRKIIKHIKTEQQVIDFFIAGKNILNQT